ncbi:Tubulin binding cofactor A [Venturia nashicola]|uniref:Tubulin-specific chaperone A n=1 Tax=Venturia nashicola TaxID=86259 RepID=A0A4Z1P2U4_9PEZI|nr:Tubulin binding cofactor A [Venturia nashicola]
MAPPSKLTISTSSLHRLIKEESSYHKELTNQQARIATLEQPSEDENAEYKLKQEKQALEETRAVLPSMKTKIKEALLKLEEQLEATGADAPESEVTKAKEVIASAKEAVKE